MLSTNCKLQMILREYSVCSGFPCCTVSSIHADTTLAEISLWSFSSTKRIAISLSTSSAFFSTSIREGRVALSVGHQSGTHSRYGCCLIPPGICGLKNNSRRITYGIGYVWGMPSLSPPSSLDDFLFPSFMVFNS